MNTQFSVTIEATVIALDRGWNVKATVSPKGWDCEPVILWLERADPDADYWVPGEVWDALQSELDTGGPARVQFDLAMNRAPVPFLAAAE